MKVNLQVLSLLALLALVSGAQAMMLEMPRATLDAGADAIVTGTVISVTSSWNADNTAIYTDVTFSVERADKGAVAAAITVRVPGGEVGDIGMAVEDMPVFKAGDRATLWLTRDGTTFELLGGLQGVSGMIDAKPSGLYSYSGYHRSPASCNYRINTAIGDWSSSIQAGTAAWNAAGAAFDFNYAGTTDIATTALDGTNAIFKGYLGTGGTIAQNAYWYNRKTKIVAENDITFNTYYEWSTTGEAGKFDVQNIATHELGHSLVLNDLYKAAQLEQTMYGYAVEGEVKKRTLESGDIQGIKVIYGVGFDKASGPRPAAID